MKTGKIEQIKLSIINNCLTIKAIIETPGGELIECYIFENDLSCLIPRENLKTHGNIFYIKNLDIIESIARKTILGRSVRVVEKNKNVNYCRFLPWYEIFIKE